MTSNKFNHFYQQEHYSFEYFVLEMTADKFIFNVTVYML